MIRIFTYCSILLCFINLSHNLFGQDAGLSLSERLKEIRARSSAHESQVALLLAQPAIKSTNFDLPPPVSPPAPSPIVPPPAPVPTTPPVVAPNSLPPASLPSSTKFEEPVESENIKLVEVTESNNTAQANEDLDNAYAKLYEPDVPSRLVGYYFGPLLGLVFPQDGAIRTGSSPMTKEDYESESGYLLGLQVGKDFGGVRVEAEYSYHNFDATTTSTILPIISTSLSASIHNFFSRLILEKELGERFDLRAGIGMGMGIVGLEGSADYSGTGFAYDFLFGVGYRLAENWSIQADYRYFLTAANDEYDHIKSHIWLLSASLDL